MKKSYRKKTHWGWQTLIVFLIVAALWHSPLMFVRERKSSKRSVSKPSQENVYLTFQSNAFSASQIRDLWADPTIYLLPSEVGFSSYIRRMSVSPKISFETIPPPNVVQAFLPSHAGEVFSSVEALTMAQSFFEETVSFDKKSAVPNDPVLQESSNWYVTGPVATRLVSLRANLPLISSDELLQATVLRIGISASGDVRFVVLDHKHTSGSEKADQAAIGFARSLKFSPGVTDDTSLAWGFVCIQWRGNDGMNIRTVP
jgi:hypothetical protein